MAVRITQNMLNSNMMRNLNNSMGKMDKLQEQASSGRKISRPSDDPVVATRGMFYRSSLIENDQFQRNVNEASAWMDTTDQAMDDVNTIIHRVKELVIQSGSTMNQDGYNAIAAEIDQLKEHLGNIANQSLGGKYIFAGNDTSHPPFDFATDTFTNQNSNDITLEVNKGIYLPINVKGVEVFSVPSTTDNIFQVLSDVSTQLRAGNNATSLIPKVDEQLSNVLAIRASLGARVNRMELIEERLGAEELNLNKLMSDNEDADMAEVITDLKMQENVHKSALGVGARIIQPSLLDFLR
ncbi:flagellar hook-associated protein FlgL [Brevibacillus parabrevis]|uniref:flagellar hook-associated protein FlgL n=1 Tax=Brevibacillus parabrevis TaxID=54914 RepID=UPI00113F1B0C|nr:flagellar hook-associated protein FlgL [Brevibacillus parabrevis]TGV31008.1 flagellar hook-associated protein FlgL [Mesorhizobium sp. M00.F.Ca.ET.186.01.1.1]